MKLFFAHAFSILLHPVILGLLIPFLVIYHTNNDFLYAVKWMGFSSLFIFLSVFVYFLFRRREFLHDMDVSDKAKRPLFYAIGIFFAIIYFIIAVSIKGIFFPLTICSLGIVIALIMFEVANFYLKVSIHAAVVAAFLTTTGMLYGFLPFLVFVWMAPAVSWSRVYLHKHSRKEVGIGIALGVFITLITFAVGKIVL